MVMRATPAVQQRSGACSMRLHRRVVNTGGAWDFVDIRDNRIVAMCPQLQGNKLNATWAETTAVLKRVEFRLISGDSLAIAEESDPEFPDDNPWDRYTSIDAAAPIQYQEYSEWLEAHGWWWNCSTDCRVEITFEFDVPPEDE